MSQVLTGPVLRHVGSSTATVWVETDQPCEVEVLGCHERTWAVAGHHYALVAIEGLTAGTSTPYEVRLDGVAVWPPKDSDRPPCRIRTHAANRPVCLSFGSCRYATAAALPERHSFEADSLACYSRKIAALGEDQWPDAFLMLGDQVYADKTTAATKRRISARRDITTGARDQVADFEEYTWLYTESWGTVALVVPVILLPEIVLLGPCRGHGTCRDPACDGRLRGPRHPAPRRNRKNSGSKITRWLNATVPHGPVTAAYRAHFRQRIALHGRSVSVRS